MSKGIRIGVMVSSKGNKLQAIIDACETGRINGKVVFVCSDNPDAYALTRARQRHIPCFIVDYLGIRQRYREEPQVFELPADCKFDDIMTKQQLYSTEDETPEALKFRMETRVIAEAHMLGEIAQYPFDLLVLAGFIRKLTPYFIEKINEGSTVPRIMNLHATLCPAFPGIDGYGQTLRHGCKLEGARYISWITGWTVVPSLTRKPSRLNLATPSLPLSGKDLSSNVPCTRSASGFSQRSASG